MKKLPAKKSNNSLLFVISFVLGLFIFGAFYLANSQDSVNILSFAANNPKENFPTPYLRPTYPVNPTPTPSNCTGGVSLITYSVPCGNNNFRNIGYTCENKTTYKEGGSTSCKSVEGWLKYAVQRCLVCKNPSPTPTPINPSACGDGVCTPNYETCKTCKEDCGPCVYPSATPIVTQPYPIITPTRFITPTSTPVLY